MKSEIPVIFTALILAGMLVGCDGQRGAVRQGDAAGASSALGVSEEDAGHADAYEQAYETLIAYKTADYRKKSIQEFRQSLGGGDYTEFMNTYGVVTEEILPGDAYYDFIMFTLGASSGEIYYEQVERSEVFGIGGQVNKDTSSEEFRFGGTYWLQYEAPDPLALTIGERDDVLRAMNEELQAYVNSLSEAEIMEGSIKTMLAQKAEELAEQLSTDRIRLSCTFMNLEIYDGTGPELSLNEEEYQMLSALWLDDYEQMTVSDFQEQEWKITDTPQYQNLLNRLLGGEALWRAEGQEKLFSFLTDVFEPLTAERWETRDFSGYTAIQDSDTSDQALLEYVFFLTIKDPDTLTVGEYDAAKKGMEEGFQAMLQDRTKEELRDGPRLEAEIRACTEALIQKYTSEKLSVSADTSCLPFSEQEPEDASRFYEEKKEQRRYPHGTREDYDSLLALKTPDYADLPLSVFNQSLLAWADEDYERMERICCDAGYDDFAVSLDDEERLFVTRTVVLSGAENAKEVQSIYMGKEAEDPSHDQYLPVRQTGGGRGAAWCELFYQFSYHILKQNLLTVGERDALICALIEEAEAYWQSCDLEELLQMEEADLLDILQKTAASHSDDRLTITIDTVSFEKMDERWMDPEISL